MQAINKIIGRINEQKSKVIFAVALSAILVFALTFSDITNTTKLKVYAAGTPDAYGQQITYVTVVQWVGSQSAAPKANITSDAYTPGMSVSIDSGKNTSFWVGVKVSKVLFPTSDPITGANPARIRVSVTVTHDGITDVNNVNLKNYELRGEDSNYWYIEAFNLQGYHFVAQADTTYSVTITFELYY